MAEWMDSGERFGDFEILGEAGRGGMGVVYKARQISLQRLVALKVITPEVSDEPDFQQRFERESRLAASIDHPNVVSVHAAGEIDGLSYIVMQWIEGTNVSEAIEHGPLDVARVASIGEQMCGALDAAHAAGLTHRDIKPGNILLRKLGSRDHAYLTDFGIAKQTAIDQKTSLTRAGSVVGTINYMAPEQIEGKAGASSDLYSLACVLFEAATGTRPFERESEVATMWAQMHAPRPRPSEVKPGIAPGFDDVIMRALALDPADRFPDGAAFAEALRRAAAGIPLPPPTEIDRRPAQAATVIAPPPPVPPPPPTDPTMDLPRRQPTGPTAQVQPRGGGAGMGGAGGAAGTGGSDSSGSDSNRNKIIGLIVIAVVAVGIIAALLLSGGGDGTRSTSTTTTTTTNGGTNGGKTQTEAQAKEQIVGVLHQYEAAYSSSDVNALGDLLTSDVSRYGVVAGGCERRSGKSAVLSTYSEQFQQNGEIGYTLDGLNSGAIDVSGESASTSLGYHLSTGGAGSVDFDLSRQGPKWLIKNITASCG